MSPFWPCRGQCNLFYLFYMSPLAPNVLNCYSIFNAIQGHSCNASNKKMSATVIICRNVPTPLDLPVLPPSNHLNLVFRMFIATSSTFSSIWSPSASGSTNCSLPSSGAVSMILMKIMMNLLVLEVFAVSLYFKQAPKPWRRDSI